jgi:alpha 1,2-mannosyltransferase
MAPALFRLRRYAFAAVLATAFVFVVLVYRSEVPAYLRDGVASLPNGLWPGDAPARPDTFKNGKPTIASTSTSAPHSATTTQTSAPDGGASHRPPWIDTPAPFDTLEIADYHDESAPEAHPGRPLALHPLLADAMDKFLRRPVLSHAQARAQNEAACPRAQLNHQVNSDQLGGDHSKWLAVDAERIVDMRRAALEFLEGRSKSEGKEALIGPGFGPDGKTRVKPGSRGIVFAAGNHNTVAKAIACIKQLQKLGWSSKDGAIEVFHFESEKISDAQTKELKQLGATPRTVNTKKAPGRWKNYELKAEAMLRSSFDEVLYLDSDNFPLGDVRSLVFDEELSRNARGGQAVFWPDLNRDHPDNAVHRLLGVPCHDAWQLDSGQIIMSKSGNKGLNLAALHLAQHMAEVEAPDDEGGGYWFSGGDKDTFRYAFLALGLPYTPAPRWLSVLGGPDKNNFCGAAMLQYGLSAPDKKHQDEQDPAHPAPLFVHANLLKHQNAFGGSTGKLSWLRRLSPTQDDVRADYPAATALHSARGGGADIPGKGLCSDITAFRGGADVETVDAKEVYGGLMETVEEEYFANPGTKPGSWRRWIIP